MSGSLPRRAATAILLGPVFVGAVLLGRIPFAIGFGLLVAIGAWELAHVVRSVGSAARAIPFVVLALYVLVVTEQLRGVPRDLLAMAALLAGAIFLFRPVSGAARRRSSAQNASPMAWSGALAATVGLGVLPAFLVLLCADSGERAVPWGPVLLAVFSVWASDTGAYLAGTTFGRNRLWPAISPQKTWEGAFGGFLAAALAAMLLAPPLQVGLGRVESLLFGSIAGIAAPVGDLIESRLKREAGVKDSGSLFPGHGGVLDRFDSLFFAAPLFYYFLRATGG